MVLNYCTVFTNKRVEKTVDASNWLMRAQNKGE